MKKTTVLLNCSFLQSLRNVEFPQAFKEICSIYDVEQIEVLYVKESLERLKAHKEELKFVMEMRNPHPLTAVLDEKSVLRRNYLLSMRGRIKASAISPVAKEKAAAKILTPWMAKHEKYIYNPSISLQTRLVDNLKTDFEENEEIGEAITALDLTPTFTEIILITTQIEESFEIRSNEYAADVLKAKGIRDRAYTSLVIFLKSLDTAESLEDPKEPFYAEYKDKIDVRLKRYKINLQSRRTRSKNAALAEEAQNIVALNVAEMDQQTFHIDSPSGLFNKADAFGENLMDGTN